MSEIDLSTYEGLSAYVGRVEVENAQLRDALAQCGVKIGRCEAEYVGLREELVNAYTEIAHLKQLVRDVYAMAQAQTEIEDLRAIIAAVVQTIRPQRSDQEVSR